MSRRRSAAAKSVHRRSGPYAVQVDQVCLVNMGQYNIQEAKTRLSELLHMVERGEEVVIAKAGKPVARIVRIEHTRKRELGFLGQIDLPDNLFDPLTEQELAEWE